MPRDPRTSYRRTARLAVFVAAGWALLALTRLSRTSAETAERAGAEPGRRRPPRRRLATTFATAMLFFAGASLTAIAGDRAAGVLEPDSDEEAAMVVAAGEEAQEGAEGDEAAEAGAGDPEPEPDPLALGTAAMPAAAEAEPPAHSEPAAEPAPDAEAAPAETAAEAAPEPEETHEPAHATAAHSDPAVTAAPLVQESTAPMLAAARAPKGAAAPKEHDHDAEPLDPEATAPGTAATVWLHRLLPDPTPPSRRLAPGFAKELLRVAKAERVHWSLVLGALRAQQQGPERGRMFAASGADVRQTAHGLAAVGARKRDRAWTALLALQGDTTLADRAVVLADYYRAVGLQALVKGLRAQEEELAKRVLADERISIYDGGRADLAEGKVDVRVVATLAFLAESFGQVTVTSLISGHRIYSRPGVVSAHVYGAAVDIAALDGQIVSPLTQNPGGLVEQAVRKLLLLPAELRARQVITLLGLGGPSFPMANHDDHIHVGF